MPEHGSPVAPSPAAKSPAPTPPPAARIIALINQKGGVGKTTTTVNLAAALAISGKRVLLVDLDPQAHATLHLGVDPAQAARSVYDLMLDWDDDPAAALIQVRDNLMLIPSETDLAAAEAELASTADRHRRLARALAPLASRFDFILIDCPPSLGLLTLNGLAAAREILIPMQAHFLALQGVSKLLETVKLVKAKLNPHLSVSGIVLCMHDSNTTHSQEVVSDLTSFFEQAREQDVPWRQAQLLQPPIRRNIKLAESPSFGQTIFDYAPAAPGALDYLALARTIIDTVPTGGTALQSSAPIIITRPTATPTAAPAEATP
jgi:chromosome partitioning protein